MNIQIITSSYPAYPDDPSGTAGLFIQSFALELSRMEHKVIIQPVARKSRYSSTKELVIEPLPWMGGDKELASLNFWAPINLFHIFIFLWKAKRITIDVHKKFKIDKTLCMWALPSGLLGYWIKKSLSAPYDVWVLGSDIWKIQRIPFLGKFLLKIILKNADTIYGDGPSLCQSVQSLTKRHCAFLPSSRKLFCRQEGPVKAENPQDILKLLFVGRYHKNKGPDILVEAIDKLGEQGKNRINLFMYGLGPLYESLKKNISERKLTENISLNGPIGEVNLVKMFNKIHYLIIPSRIESIPVIFSDAIQSGVPVISTPAGDLPNLIQQYNCGIVSDSISPESLAQAIRKALKISRSNFIQGTKHLAPLFNISNSVKQWLLNNNGASDEIKPLS